MLYTGDTHVFLLSLTHSDGSVPSVTTAPFLQIVNARTQTGVFVSAAPMALIPGTVLVYSYNWWIPVDGSITTDDYFAIVSYVADGNTISNAFLESFRIGDSYVTGPVALNATVALNSTVAKDATVAHVSDLTAISPENSASVAAIKAQTDLIPASPLALDSSVRNLFNMLTVLSSYTLGNIIINKEASPPTMTVTSWPDNYVIAVFNLIDESSQSGRSRID